MFYFENLCFVKSFFKILFFAFFVNLESDLTTYTLELGSEIIFVSVDQYFGYFL